MYDFLVVSNQQAPVLEETERVYGKERNARRAWKERKLGCNEVCVRERRKYELVRMEYVLDIPPVLTYSQAFDMYQYVWSWRGFLPRRLSFHGERIMGAV